MFFPDLPSFFLCDTKMKCQGTTNQIAPGPTKQKWDKKINLFPLTHQEEGQIKQSVDFQQNTEISTGRTLITLAQNIKTAEGGRGKPTAEKTHR